jgi:hypothetical protein
MPLHRPTPRHPTVVHDAPAVVLLAVLVAQKHDRRLPKPSAISQDTGSAPQAVSAVSRVPLGFFGALTGTSQDNSRNRGPIAKVELAAASGGDPVASQHTRYQWQAATSPLPDLVDSRLDCRLHSGRLWAGRLARIRSSSANRLSNAPSRSNCGGDVAPQHRLLRWWDVADSRRFHGRGVLGKITNFAMPKRRSVPFSDISIPRRG